MEKEKELVQIMVRDSYGFNKTITDMIISMFENSDAIYIQLLNPNSISAYFSRIKNDVISELLNKIYVYLKDNVSYLENTKIYMCKERYAIVKENNNIKIILGGSLINKKENIKYEINKYEE